ncbi:MAG: hypothetical protein K2X76_15255, partial [Sphingomonas sp.]|nr:hypothetical protein [Sphingomonas sp.]
MARHQIDQIGAGLLGSRDAIAIPLGHRAFGLQHRDAKPAIIAWDGKPRGVAPDFHAQRTGCLVETLQRVREEARLAVRVQRLLQFVAELRVDDRAPIAPIRIGDRSGCKGEGFANCGEVIPRVEERDVADTVKLETALQSLDRARIDRATPNGRRGGGARRGGDVVPVGSDKLERVGARLDHQGAVAPFMLDCERLDPVKIGAQRGRRNDRAGAARHRQIGHIPHELLQGLDRATLADGCPAKIGALDRDRLAARGFLESGAKRRCVDRQQPGRLDIRRDGHGRLHHRIARGEHHGATGSGLDPDHAELCNRAPFALQPRASGHEAGEIVDGLVKRLCIGGEGEARWRGIDRLVHHFEFLSVACHHQAPLGRCGATNRARGARPAVSAVIDQRMTGARHRPAKPRFR